MLIKLVEQDLTELLPAARAIAASTSELADLAAEDLSVELLGRLAHHAGRLCVALTEFRKGCEQAVGSPDQRPLKG